MIKLNEGVAIPYEAGLGLSPRGSRRLGLRQSVSQSPMKRVLVCHEATINNNVLVVTVAIPYEAGLGLSQKKGRRGRFRSSCRNPL